MERTVNIHTRKYYRVVLESVDSSLVTPEGFAIKLTLRLRMTTPRAKSVVNHLPSVIRSNMSTQEANKLKAILEEIGGICRLETHFVTPGEERPARSKPDLRKSPPPNGDTVGGTFECPQCGSVEADDAPYCSMCHRKFRSAEDRSKSLGARIPQDNPLEGRSFRAPDEETDAPGWQRYKWAIVAGVLLVVLLVFIIK